MKVGIAVLGGTAKLAWDVLGGAKPPVWHFFMRAIVSCFIGVLGYHIFPRDAEWSYAATGLTAWLGADGISLLVAIIRDRKAKDKP